MKYADYITSPAWYARRRKWWDVHEDRTGTRIMLCPGGCGTQVNERDDDMHHMSYDRLGDELHTDLLPLCRRCHETVHMLIENSPNWRKMDRAQATTAVLNLIRFTNM